MKIVGCIFLLITSSLAQFIIDGPCPKVESMKDLDMSQIIGNWYEIGRCSNLYELGLKCCNVTFTPLDYKTMKLETFGINSFSGALNSFEALVNSHHDNTKILFSVTLPEFAEKNTADITIPHTDYDNFMMIHMCESLGRSTKSLIHFWILSRLKFLTAKFLDYVKRIMSNHNLPESELMAVDQQNCPYD